MTELRTIILIAVGLAIGLPSGFFCGQALTYEKFVTPESVVAERLAMLVEE